MPKRVDMEGRRYGRLIVLKDKGENGELIGEPSRRQVLVICDCGTEKLVNARSVRRGRTQSCGCLQRERATTHGKDRHPLTQVWRAMRNRCESPKNIGFAAYGGRGITVCEQWRENVTEFIRWAEKNGWEPGLQIDRKDNDLGYSPENCRLVTVTKNANNTRRNRRIEVAGEVLTIAEASRKYNVPYDRLHQRILRLGWSPRDAVSR